MASREPPSAVAARWEELLGDADGLAAEYDEAGWRTHVLSTGDVTPRSGDPFGLDVVVPPAEFESLRELVDGTTFDTSRVYRDEGDGIRFFIVVQEASTDGVAVLVPAFISVDATDDVEATAREAGTMYTHVRSPAGDERVTFVHDDPDLFF